MASLFLGGAHFWRGGRQDLAFLCILLGLLAWSRQAWLRYVLCLALPLLAGRWIWTAGQIAQVRLMLSEPWQRMAAVLLGVAAVSAVSALLLATRAGERRYSRQRDAAMVQTAAFGLICALLSAVHHFQPQALLLNRFLSGGGGAQVFLCAAWGAWVAGKLSDRAESAKIRMRVWRLFSCVFFAQLALGLAGYTRFLMTETPHIPVPCLIIASPLYRGEGLFMPALFGVSVLLCGAAWCSHLCYFGVWDATAAQRRPAGPPPAWFARTRYAALAAVVGGPLLLHATGMPGTTAALLGIGMGLLCLPLSWFASRRTGLAGYCLAVCPLGTLAVWLGKLAPWRIRLNERCTHCRKCVRQCRYGGLTEQGIEEGRVSAQCRLCRTCLHICPHGGVEMRIGALRDDSGIGDRILVTLLATLHAVFLGVAMA